jgi:hypothetical protein
LGQLLNVEPGRLRHEKGTGEAPRIAGQPSALEMRAPRRGRRLFYVTTYQRLILNPL